MKRNLSKLFLVAGLAAMTTACGDTGTKKDAPGGESKDLQGREYLVIEDAGLETSSEQVSGKGTIGFLTPTSDKAASYALSFELAEGGSVALVTNAAVGLKNGVAVKFTRSSDKLKAEITAAGKTADLSFRFNTTAATGKLDLVIDVHNDETPSHVLTWVGNGPYTDENAVYDSEADVASPGNGTGNIWGLVLDDATVFSAAAGAPKFSH